MNRRLSPALRLPAAIFAGTLLLGGIAFALALDRHSKSQAELLGLRQQAEAAAGDLRHTPDRLARDRSQAAGYAQLRNSGFIGAEDRLDWVSSLARIRAEMRLQTLAWRLSPQESSSLGNGLRVSHMNLDLAPADSARLDLFFAALRKQAHGRYTLSGCSLQPDAEQASCTLEWWTWNAE